MDTSDLRPWTDEEQERLLSQEEADALPVGAKILFRNSMGTGPSLEAIELSKGQVPKWKPRMEPIESPCAVMVGGDWLYNVGKTQDKQQVCLYQGKD